MTSLTIDKMLTLGAMLLAFLIAFYALIAREKKSPLLLHSMFYAAYALLLLLILALLPNITLSLNTANVILVLLVCWCASSSRYYTIFWRFTTR